MKEPDAFPSEFLALLLKFSPAALGYNCRSICVSLTTRRLPTQGVRNWRPQL